MPDREKVIKGLNYCTHTDGTECPNCPYWQDEDCVETLHADVLALLKEQEPKQVEAEVINEIDRLYRCPSCHISMILRKQPYCHSCGQELDWE